MTDYCIGDSVRVVARVVSCNTYRASALHDIELYRRVYSVSQYGIFTGYRYKYRGQSMLVGQEEGWAFYPSQRLKFAEV